MSAITTMDGVVAGLAGGTFCSIQKASMTVATGAIYAMWRTTGFPIQPAIPGTTAAVCDDTIAGAFVLPAVSPLYFLRASIVSTVPAHWMFYDRIMHVGGLSGTVTTAQTVGVNLTSAVSQSRCLSTGADVEWYLECYTALGATTTTATITYTNQAGTTGQTTSVTIPATWPASQCLRILPSTGYIQSVQSVTLAASTLTAGSFGVTARKRITALPQPLANVGVIADAIALGAPLITQYHCIEILMLPTTTSSGIILADFKVGAPA